MKVIVKVNEVTLPAAGSVGSVEFSAEYTVEEFTKLLDTLPSVYEKVIGALSALSK